MYIPVESFKHNQQLGRGINIIGYDPIWHSTAEGRIKSKHFQLIREAGFNHVRIDLQPFKFMGDAPDYTLNPDWLKTLDWVLLQCQENGLLAILDLHEHITMGKGPVEKKPKFLAFWRQISTLYQEAPQSVLFEILNEPGDELEIELWNEFLNESLQIIRETNPTRTVLIGSGWGNSIDKLHELEMPESDRHIIVTVHYYRPLDFTHQGAPWSPDTRDKSNIHWLGLPNERQSIQADFAQVQAWSEEFNRPIHLGEFGAYDKGEMSSRAIYTDAVARTAEALGWSWAYWQFDSDFIAYDIDKDCWVEPIRNALIPN